MPTTHTAGLVTTSTAVATVGKSSAGTPVFVTTEQQGWLVTQTAVVLTGGGSTTVSIVAFTGTHPGG